MKMTAINVNLFSDNIDHIMNTIRSKNVNVDKRSLLYVLKVILNSFDSKHLDEYIDLLTPYVAQHKLSRKDILQLSHVFCKCCLLYKPSMLCTWVEENPELFDTEVFVFDKFFRKYTSLKKDISIYPLEELFTTSLLPVFEQSKSEKLKTLNTIIAYYPHIVSYNI